MSDTDPPHLSVLSVNLAASSVEGMLYGIFISLAVASICLLVHRRWSEVNSQATVPVTWTSAVQGLWRSTLCMATILFVAIITAHWAIGVRRVFEAFMYYDNGEEASEYFSNLWNPLEVARTALLIFTLLTGDIILVHRAWIVWNRNHWVALLPSITSTSLIACGVGVLHQFSVKSSKNTIFTEQIIEWVIGAVISTLITKIYGTLMISYRIWSVTKTLKESHLHHGGRSIFDALMIIIESSTLSTVWTLFFAIVYATKSTLQSFSTGCSPAINGIAFMLITVRVGLGWDLQIGVTGSADNPRPATISPFQAYPLRSIRMTVTRTVVQEADFAIRSHDDSESSPKRAGSVLDLHT